MIPQNPKKDETASQRSFKNVKCSAKMENVQLPVCNPSPSAWLVVQHFDPFDMGPLLTCSSSHCPRWERDGRHILRHQEDPGSPPGPPHRESHLLTTWLEQWEELHGPSGQMEREQTSEEIWRDSGTQVEDCCWFPSSLMWRRQCEEEDGRRRNTETERRTTRLILPQI